MSRYPPAGPMLTGRPEGLLLLFCAAVAAAAGYDLYLQCSAVPSAMRYVPAASPAYVVTSPLRDLWNAARPHVEPFFDDDRSGRETPDDPTPARRMAQEIRTWLDRNGIELRNAEDLPRIGIDPSGHAAFALIGTLEQPRLLVALPVVDRAKFEETLARVGGSPVALEGAGTRAGPQIYTSGETVFGFGPDGSVVMSDDAEVVRGTLDEEARNLAYHRGADRTLRGFADMLAGRVRGADGWLRGSVTPGGAPVPLLRDAQFLLAIDERAAVWRARTAIATGRAEVLARLLSVPAANDVASEVLSRSNAAVVLAGESLPHLLRHLPPGALARQFAGLDALFPGLLDELRATAGFDRASIAATEESRRVPGVVLGLRMPAEEADALVFRLQRALRAKRDREVLAGALDRYRNENAAGEAQPTIDALVAGGLLAQSRHPLWQHYALENGRPVATRLPDPQDFDNGDYRVERGARVFRYVLPPVTRDDFAYRFRGADSELDAEALQRDEHRLCSSYSDGTLWFGNDADVLERWLARPPQADIDAERRAASAYMDEAVPPTLEAFARPRELFDSGQLYPDRGVNEQTRALLADLRHYRALLLSVSTRPDERQIDVEGTLLLH